jgi:hypothetical protein
LLRLLNIVINRTSLDHAAISVTVPCSDSISAVSHSEQVFFPAIEAHVNAIATAIFGKPSVERLMDVADQVSDEPKCNALLIPCCVWQSKHP